MNKYQLDFTSTFKRDYKRVKKRGYDMGLLNQVVDRLQKGEALPEKKVPEEA